MTLTEMLSKSYTTRTARLAIQKQADVLEQQEKDLQYEIQKYLEATSSLCDGVQIHDEFSLDISTKDEPLTTDWPRLLEYIKTTGSVDLLQKRLTVSAVKQRWDDKIELPGVDHVNKVAFKISKV